MKFGFIESSVGLDRLATGDEICCAMSLSFPGVPELVGLCDDFSKMDSHSSGRACNLLEHIEWLTIVREMRDSIIN
jgi:hypothetical protein